MKSFIQILLILFLTSCHKKEISKIDRETYDKAYDFYDISQDDSAFTYFNRAKDELIEKGYYSFAGNSLVIMAIIQWEKGDYYGSQETALSALQYLNEKKDSAELSANYNNLGLVSQNLKEYEKAITFHNNAAKFSTEIRYKLAQTNNKAVCYSSLKKYDSAISILNKALLSPELKKYPITYYRIYDNLAYNKFLKDSLYNAEPELSNALQNRIKEKDIDGQLASLSHLSDFLKTKNSQESLVNAKKMLEISSSNNMAEEELQALQKIILLEKPEKIKPYFEKYQQLNDSLISARNKSKSQFALERYDAEKLKTENIQKENRILIQNIGIASLAVLLFSSITGGAIWYKRRKKRLQQENELKIKENELKLSKKVHDVVANGIYQVMTKIENQENFDKDKALDELEFVYEKSRDISYEKEEADYTVEFAEKIFTLIDSFKSDHVKPFLTGNSQNIWNGVNETTQDEIFQVIRELLVNMNKHSQANLVVFKFEKNNDLIHIQYKDNGIGISGEIIQGNGLMNTVSRIERIKGTIIFDNKTEKGLKINISFPAS